jgi:superfamily II DNA or RNA helicase
MSSVIELYEHNQKAYDALLDMLGERDRACIIKPTGTGKFVIIAKMVQDNPDKRFLLLGTNDYMFNDQMANLAEIAPGFTPENLQFMTYAAAMGMERRNDCVPPYDVIIADEFHHCGAEEWGKGVTHILNANESAKVVGFTATPIRYSDGGRNMADEIIGYNVGFDLGFLSAVGVRPREDAIITDTMNLFTWFMGRRYKLVDAADHIGYEWTGRAHGSLADALATLAVQRWLEQWLVAE